jgi:hypothetical protein
MTRDAKIIARPALFASNDSSASAAPAIAIVPGEINCLPSKNVRIRSAIGSASPPSTSTTDFAPATLSAAG